jgi:hypothetical protein
MRAKIRHLYLGTATLLMLLGCKREPFQPETPREPNWSELEQSFAHLEINWGVMHAIGAVVIAPGVLLTSAQVVRRPVSAYGPVPEEFKVVFANPREEEEVTIERVADVHDFAVLRCGPTARRCRSAKPLELARGREHEFQSDVEIYGVQVEGERQHVTAQLGAIEVKKGVAQGRSINIPYNVQVRWCAGCPVFDRNGRLIGLISPSRAVPLLNPIDGAVEGEDSILAKHLRAPKTAWTPFPEAGRELFEHPEEAPAEPPSRGELDGSVVQILNADARPRLAFAVAPGVLLTLRRNVASFRPFTLVFNNPREEEQAIVARVEGRLAVLSCPPDSRRCAHVPPLRLGRGAELELGSAVQFLSTDGDLLRTLVRGKVSYKARRKYRFAFHEVDVQLPYESNGGPALDERGRVIGVLDMYGPAYVLPIEEATEGPRAILQGFVPTAERLSWRMQEMLDQAAREEEEETRLYRLERR